MVWDGIERRQTQRDGMEGRRVGDYHCPDHHMIQESTKEHRQIVCGKIRTVKADAEHDLEELKKYHDSDLAEVKTELGTKADIKDLRGLVKFVGLMVTICCIVVGGIAMWLRSDITNGFSDVGTKIQRLNQRVTEGVDERVKMDIEQTKQLENISGEMRVVSWRLSQLEDAHKVK